MGEFEKIEYLPRATDGLLDIIDMCKQLSIALGGEVITSKYEDQVVRVCVPPGNTKIQAEQGKAVNPRMG